MVISWSQVRRSINFSYDTLPGEFRVLHCANRAEVYIMLELTCSPFRAAAAGWSRHLLAAASRPPDIPFQVRMIDARRQ